MLVIAAGGGRSRKYLRLATCLAIVMSTISMIARQATENHKRQFVAHDHSNAIERVGMLGKDYPM
jgi:hypothetical protein